MTGAAPTLADLVGGRDGWRAGPVYAHGPCPCCGSKTGGWASVTRAGAARVGCFSCGDWASLRRAFGLDAGCWSKATFTAPPPTSGRTTAPDLVEDADALHAVYTAFLKHLPMSADRRRTILGRDRAIPPPIRSAMADLVEGVPEDAARWREVRRALLSDLGNVAPAEFLRRVPELAGREGGTFAVLRDRRKALYFEPWRDELGRIQALRAYMGRRAKVRYLTTRGRTGPLLHVAYGAPGAGVAMRPWLFTEGWLKAEVAAHALGVTAVAFAGLGGKQAWRRAAEVKQRLAPEAPAYVAFDAEAWASRLDIGVLALELALEIQRASGQPAGFAVWDARPDADGAVAPKGVDDAVVAGVPIQLVDRRGFAAAVAPLLDREERHARLSA